MDDRNKQSFPDNYVETCHTGTTDLLKQNESLLIHRLMTQLQRNKVLPRQEGRTPVSKSGHPVREEVLTFILSVILTLHTFTNRVIVSGSSIGQCFISVCPRSNRPQLSSPLCEHNCISQSISVSVMLFLLHVLHCADVHKTAPLVIFKYSNSDRESVSNSS